METATLSSTIRKVTSAPDQRPSAQAVGAVGIVMLVIPAVIIVLPDVVTVVYAVVETFQAWKRRLYSNYAYIARFYLIGPTFVHEHSWEYSANIVGS